MKGQYKDVTCGPVITRPYTAEEINIKSLDLLAEAKRNIKIAKICIGISFCITIISIIIRLL